MSPRRVIIGTCLIALAAAGTSSAFADGGISKKHHNELCLVLAQDDSGDVTKDFCVTWPGPTQ